VPRRLLRCSVVAPVRRESVGRRDNNTSGRRHDESTTRTDARNDQPTDQRPTVCAAWESPLDDEKDRRDNAAVAREGRRQDRHTHTHTHTWGYDCFSLSAPSPRPVRLYSMTSWVVLRHLWTHTLGGSMSAGSFVVKVVRR